MFFLSKTQEIPITIGITTFVHRFEKYFIPLLKKIREKDPVSEIIVTINGEHEQDFNETYRAEILQFIATQPGVYPIFFPRFRSLAKLWNTIVIHATHDHILLLNDDIQVNDPKFQKKICKALRDNKMRSFLINNSWSHFLISRNELDELGYFDERLLGIGEEDGDMTWRYIKNYKTPPKSFKMKFFHNFAEETMNDHVPTNIKSRPNSKYSEFNRNFMYSVKYQPSINGIQGMFDTTMELLDTGPRQYPNEKFFRNNKNKI